MLNVMHETWPLLSDIRLEGAHSIDRVLRPPNPAQAVARNDFEAATDAIRRACDAWGGAYMPLIPVDASEPIDQRWVDILDHSPVDGMDDHDLVDTQPQFGYGFRTHINSGLFLLRQLMDLPMPADHATVQTAGGLSAEDPWYLSYLATFGDHPLKRAPDKKQINRIRDDYDYGDVVPVEGFSGTPGAEDLLTRLRRPNTMTAVQLTLSSLTYSAAPVALGFPSSARIQLGTHHAARRYGPNVVIVYEPESVDDLALLWYLRALHGFPAGFPLGIPNSADVADVLSLWHSEQAYKVWGWNGGDMTLISASVPLERLLECTETNDFQVSTPDEVLQPFGGCGLFATDTAHYTNGRAQIPRFARIVHES